MLEDKTLGRAAQAPPEAASQPPKAAPRTGQPHARRATTAGLCAGLSAGAPVLVSQP